MTLGRAASIGAALLAAATLGACSSPAAKPGATGADPGCRSGTATVTSQAQGDALAVPNLLTVTVGVTLSEPTAQAALDQNSAKANALIASLRQNGVVDADIQTSLLSIQQTYSPPPNPVLTGYQVTNEVTVKLHDLTKAGSLIDGAAKAAGNAVHIENISYSISDDSALAQQARQDAVTRATAQARAMAAGAGMRLGALCSVTDLQPQVGYPFGVQGASGGAVSGGGSSVLPPVEAGTQQVTAQVTAVYQVIR
jgi:uncharacterized protein YggE